MEEQDYWTGMVSVLIYNIGVVFLGYALIRTIFPEQEYRFWMAEGLVALLLLISSAGIIVHMLGHAWWIARWAFLFSVVGALCAGLTFAVGAAAVSGPGTVGISLLILAGAVVALNMHIEHGGERVVNRKKRHRGS